MANKQDKLFIDFVMESNSRWISQRQICKDWKEETWDSCHRETVKAVLEANNPIEWLANKSGASLESVSGWYIKSDGSMSLRIKLDKEVDRLKEMKEWIIGEIKKYSPSYKKIKRVKSKDWHLLVISLTDLHIWKLCTEFATWEEYNSDIAVQRALEWVRWLINKAQWYNIDKIIFIWGHDILHTDWATKKTTKWTQQDTSGMRYDNFIKAKRLYIEICEMLIPIADVEFVYAPSNHDYWSWFFLAQTIEAWFNGNKNISFKCNLKHRKYTSYGNSLIWISHWDWAKENTLWMLMSVEAKDLWGDAKHRYFYLWHVHHRVAKEYPNVTVEYTRSLSWSDIWHNNSGYVSSKALEWFIHSKEWWQVAKFTHIC